MPSCILRYEKCSRYQSEINKGQARPSLLAQAQAEPSEEDLAFKALMAFRKADALCLDRGIILIITTIIVCYDFIATIVYYHYHYLYC